MLAVAREPVTNRSPPAKWSMAPVEMTTVELVPAGVPERRLWGKRLGILQQLKSARFPVFCLFLFLQERIPGWNLAIFQNKSLETDHPGRTLTVE